MLNPNPEADTVPVIGSAFETAPADGEKYEDVRALLELIDDDANDELSAHVEAEA